jgi:hypothetical protein
VVGCVAVTHNAAWEQGAEVQGAGTRPLSAVPEQQCCCCRCCVCPVRCPAAVGWTTQRAQQHQQQQGWLVPPLPAPPPSLSSITKGGCGHPPPPTITLPLARHNCGRAHHIKVASVCMRSKAPHSAWSTTTVRATPPLHCCLLDWVPTQGGYPHPQQRTPDPYPSEATPIRTAFGTPPPTTPTSHVLP